MTYRHQAHPRLRELKEQSAPKVSDEHIGGNGKIALWITKVVGTMWCAYAFAVIALISLPEAIKSGVATTIAWIAQTFLQLVLLSIIMVGQDVAAKAADKRSENTFKDAEAILHEALSLQQHLADQDKAIAALLKAHDKEGK